jgi:hypothetical protein
MTLEQAKTAKLQKGYALEPVRVEPGSEQLPQKRERKKVLQFGASSCHVPHSSQRRSHLLLPRVGDVYARI